MQASVATSIEQAENLLKEAKKLVDNKTQAYLTWEGSDVGMAVNQLIAKAILQDTQRNLNKIKKARGHVH